MNRFEQNSDRHDCNTFQRSDLQSTFCRKDIFKKSVNKMGINLPYHLKILENKQFLEENYNFFYNRAYVLYRIICVTIFHHGRRNSS